jgi:hypothetical protein
MFTKLGWPALLLSTACSSTVAVEVQIVDPCNQDAVQEMEYLRLEPRGDGIDSAGLSTIVEVGQASAPAIKIPLAADFQLVASGYSDDSFQDIRAIGVSAKRDLSNAEDTVEVRVPFALVDNFYKTTRLDDSGECTQLTVARYGATATFLPGSGKVLVVGGANLAMVDSVPTLSYVRLIEIYDPNTGEFLPMGELPQGGARAFHTATLISDDGLVLIAGGQAHGSAVAESLRSALIIDASDPASVRVAEQGIAMRQARTGHIAAKLADGRVLLAGGRLMDSTGGAPLYLSSVEIYDPDARSFVTPTDASQNAVEMSTARFGHSGFTLKGGFNVVVAGGMNESGPSLSMEVLRIDGTQMTSKVSSGVSLGVGAIFHAGDVGLSTEGGEVLLSGGYNTVADAEPTSGSPMNPTSNVEMYTFDPQTQEMNKLCSDSTSAARAFHSVSMVGRRLIFIGGRGSDGSPVPSSETATLNTGAGCFTAPPVVTNMTDARAQHAVAKLAASGEVMVVGGIQQTASEVFGRSIDSAEIFSPRRDP